MAVVKASLVSRSGQDNAVGGSLTADLTIFLKVFAGEVLAAFEEKSVMMGRHTVKTITSGKTAQLPVTGKAAAIYHTVGEDIVESSGGTSDYLQQIGVSEKLIHIDSRLIAPTMISDLDEAMQHYETRSIFASELGNALANQMDETVLQVGILASQQATGNITSGVGTPAGTDVVDALIFGNGAGTAADTRAAMLLAAAVFDQNDIPKDERYLFVDTTDYYWILDNLADVLINTDLRGMGSVARGQIPMAYGFQIVPTTHYPSGVVAAAPLHTNNTYDGTFTNDRALFMHKSAVGTAKLRDVDTQAEYLITKQGTLIVARVLVGHGILRPESAYSIRTA